MKIYADTNIQPHIPLEKLEKTYKHTKNVQEANFHIDLSILNGLQ